MGRSSRWVAVAVCVGTGCWTSAAEPPRVELTYETSLSTPSPHLEVAVRAVPPAGVRITEVTVGVGDGEEPMRPGDGPHRYVARVELEPGQNRVEVNAWDSQSRTVRVTWSVFYCTGLPPSGELIRVAAEAGRITPQQALVYRAFASFRDARLPEEYRGDDSQGPDTTILFDLGAKLQTLSPEQQKVARGMLLPLYVPERRFEFDRTRYEGPKSRTACPDNNGKPVGPPRRHEEPGRSTPASSSRP